MADSEQFKASLAPLIVATPVFPSNSDAGLDAISTNAMLRARSETFLALLRAIRAHQWTKNLLVFVPLFLSHTLFRGAKILAAAEAFLALSAAASAIYILNDLLDLDTDRKHPRKRHRPFAAGLLDYKTGLLMVAVLLLISAIVASLLPRSAQLLILLYVMAAVLYSLALKQLIFMDIAVLAGLYTLRILLGGASSSTEISPWTLAFAIFLFTSLAICKRLSELRRASVGPDGTLPRRAYSQKDLPLLAALGAASAYASVLVLALYLNSPEVALLYGKAHILWYLCPVLTYWISRILIIANRGDMHDDPIVFAYRDLASYAAAAAVLIIVLCSL